MDMVNVKINNVPVSVPKGFTILEAARQAGIDIPTLCYMREVNEIGACRICVVEIKGGRSLVAACTAPVSEGMEVLTNTDKLRTARRLTLDLILSTHNKDCLSCIRSGNCELQKLCHDFSVEDTSKYDGANQDATYDTTAIHMVRDNSKCVLCRRCSSVCGKTQAVGVIGPNDRGFKTHIGCAFEEDFGNVACVSCGQCVVACPTGALYEKDETDKVWAALADPKKHVVVQTAPSIRVTLGEEFGLPIGANVEGKMAAALRRIGFDGVFDTDFSADLTIVEEAREFLDRVKNGGTLPVITSCSPGWVRFCEHYFPELIPHLSTCKSPQQMFGAVAKTWYAEKEGIDPKDIFVVGVMPCTAKKFEARREGESAAGNGIPDVDVALTTREIARMIRKAGIIFTNLPDETFDEPLGASTGASVLFGATGGVMEAALRTAVEELSGEELQSLDFKEVRGTDGIKKAEYDVAGMKIRVAVASGLANAKRLLEMVKNKEEEFHFIEIMACPGGCVNGGGQPVQPASVRNFIDLKGLRARSIYEADNAKPLRKSHKNPAVIQLYDEYLGKPGSHRAHEVLHTSYQKREPF